MIRLKFVLAAAIPFFLLACGTTVSLDESNISDAKGVAVQPGSSTTGDGGQSIKPVNLADDKTAGQGPKNLALTIYFDFDSDVVKPEFQAIVAGHAKHLSQYKSVRVFIEGHTDERGGREYNLALGQKRAEAVRRALSLLGVAESQVEAVSFGKEKPADPGSSEESMAKNRRAQISYR
jgi:peptidoglycan-associated lipoprotein